MLPTWRVHAARPTSINKITIPDSDLGPSRSRVLTGTTFIHRLSEAPVAESSRTRFLVGRLGPPDRETGDLDLHDTYD
jgi:hypothetical protein